MTWGAVGGAAIGAVGSIIGGSSQPKVKWRPMGTENLWGSTSFDKKNKRMNQTLSPWAQGMADNFQEQASGYGSSPLLGIGQGMQQSAAGAMSGYVDAANNYGMPDEGLYQGAMQGMGQYANLFGGLAGAAANNPYALQQMQLGQGLMGERGQSYQDVFQNKFNQLNAAAQPFEERAQNSLMNKLYGMGQLGTPGGALGMESFARGLGQAQTQRGIDAMNLSEGLYGRDQANATQLRGLGANLFAGGVGNWMQGLGQAGDLGRLGLGATTGMYDLGMNWNQAGYTRANDRLARTSDLFGFGSTVEGRPMEMQGKYMNMLSGLTGEQGKMLELGLSAAGPGAPMGGNPTGQALGGFLGGLGQGMMTGNIDFGSLFRNPGGSMNSQGIGLSQSMLDGAFKQIDGLGW